MANIYLVGMPGCGKSRIAKHLADHIEWEYVDLDLELQKDVGMTINDYVKTFGWEKFEKKESEILENFSNQDKLVISTGGRSVKSERNRIIMKKGFVVFLYVDLEVLVQRVEEHKSSSRPFGDPNRLEAEVRERWEERKDFYREVANLEVDVSFQTDNLKDDMYGKVEKILNGLKHKGFNL